MDDVNDGAVLLFFLLFDAQITESKTSSIKYNEFQIFSSDMLSYIHETL